MNIELFLPLYVPFALNLALVSLDRFKPDMLLKILL
jgi:hypothetical protein